VFARASLLELSERARVALKMSSFFFRPFLRACENLKKMDKMDIR
jgi:hypothetical protein